MEADVKSSITLVHALQISTSIKVEDFAMNIMHVETSHNYHVNVTMSEAHKPGSTLKPKVVPNYTFRMRRHFLALTKY